MQIKKFEDIIDWQKAQDLAFNIYSKFNTIKDFGFKDKISKAVVPISNNIAEGIDRSFDADLLRFLCIAISSSSEVKLMLYLVERLKYINYDLRLITND